MSPYSAVFIWVERLYDTEIRLYARQLAVGVICKSHYVHKPTHTHTHTIEYIDTLYACAYILFSKLNCYVHILTGFGV